MAAEQGPSSGHEFSCWSPPTHMSGVPVGQDGLLLALMIVFVALGAVERYLHILEKVIEIQQRLDEK